MPETDRPVIGSMFAPGVSPIGPMATRPGDSTQAPPIPLVVQVVGSGGLVVDPGGGRRGAGPGYCLHKQREARLDGAPLLRWLEGRGGGVPRSFLRAALLVAQKRGAV